MNEQSTEFYKMVREMSKELERSIYEQFRNKEFTIIGSSIAQTNTEFDDKAFQEALKACKKLKHEVRIQSSDAMVIKKVVNGVEVEEPDTKIFHILAPNEMIICHPEIKAKLLKMLNKED